MVLLILGLIWAAALLPPFIRARLEGNPVDSVGRFRRHLRVLESTSPVANSLANSPVMAGRPNMPAAWANEARRLRDLRRRQQVALVLLAVMGSTLVVGLIPALHAVLAIHVLADLAFAGYIYLLVQKKEQAKARRLAELRAEGAAIAASHDDVVADGSHFRTNAAL